MQERKSTIRSIVVAGILAALVLLLGSTRLGFIPVPTPAGNATIMHIPVIIGGILEGWGVGLILGALFGFFSFINATIPLFKDPLVAILPRLFIGITAALSYTLVTRANQTWRRVVGLFVLFIVGVFAYQVGKQALWMGIVVAAGAVVLVLILVFLTRRLEHEATALAVASTVGTLTNTILVLTMAVVRGYLSVDDALTIGVVHGVPEVVVAVLITASVVLAWRRVRGELAEPSPSLASEEPA